MSFAIGISRQFTTNDRIMDILWYGGNFLALMLYPILASLILRKKIDLWINVCFFSMVGGIYSVLIMYVVNAFQLKAWTNVGLGVFGLFFVGYILISNVEKNFAFQQEWDSPFWEKLNQLSFMQFLFLRFDSIDNNAG